MAATVRALILLLFLAGQALAAGADLAGLADAAVARREAFAEGQGGWRFLPAELRFASKLARADLEAQVAPAITAIADFASQLRDQGIQLLVVPVPPKALLRGEALGVSAEQQSAMNAGWEKILADLRGREVDVVDLAPAFAAAEDEPFCLRDSHWSGPGIALAAEHLLPRLAQAGLEAGRAPAEAAVWTAKTINGDLGGDQEEVRLQIRNTGADPAASKGHPLLMLGDSHLLVFHSGGDLHATGAGLPDQLGAALGAMPDVIGVMGSGATSSRVALARRVRADSSYLPTKKVVVWCFAGREFTEADSWKKIPLQRPAP